MSAIILKIIAAAPLLAVWPTFLKKSGLSETNSLLAFFLVVLICVLPIAVRNGITLAGANWRHIIMAGCCSAIGLLLMMDALAKAPPESIGKLLLIMTVTQIVALAVYQAFVIRDFTLKMAAGFVTAILTAFFLM